MKTEGMRTQKVFVDGRWVEMRLRPIAKMAECSQCHALVAADRTVLGRCPSCDAKRLERMAANSRANKLFAASHNPSPVKTKNSIPLVPARCNTCRNIAAAKRMKNGICPACQDLQRSRALDMIAGKRSPCRCLDCRSLYLTADRGLDYCPKCTRERRIAEVTGQTYNKPLNNSF